ncbi:hypothetical protein SUDANB43_03372 [Streptomyces sp. enrichment culture]
MWARVGAARAERAEGRSVARSGAGKRARRSGAQPGLDRVARLRRPASGEAFALRRSDVDVAGGFLLVDENLAEANGVLVFDIPKSHQKRLLRLAPSLAKRLGAYLEELPTGGDALLFTTFAGKPLHYNQWRKTYFDPAVLAAGLTDVTPHDLRVSHGTWVADRYGVMTAAHRLGHSNASVTTRHYARPVAGRGDQVAEAAEAWLKGQEGDGSPEARRPF